MNAVISVALPVFAVIAAGFISGRIKALSASDAQSLNLFVFRVAMPIALFGLAARTPPPGLSDVPLAGAYALAGALAVFVAYAASKKIFALTGPEAGAHSFSSTLGNAVFLGLPIALNVEGWARPFIVLMLIEGTILIALGAALMSPREKHANPLSLIAGPARNPLVLGMALGFLYSAFGLPLTGAAETFFDMLGRAAGPAALFSLGLFLATHAFPPIKQVAGRVAMIGAAKMALLPSAALALAFAFGLSDPAALGALALFTFTPSGVASFVMASQYGVYKTETAAAVLATTLLAVFSISAVLIVFA